MPGRIVVDEPDMLAVLYAAGHLFMFYMQGKQMIVVTHRHPHRCLAPRDLGRQPSYIHHKSQIIYLRPSLVSRRSSIIVIACHCHLSSSSSVLHIQQQSSIVNHQALTINNQSWSVHIFITHPSYIACRRHRHYRHIRHHPSSIINIIQNRLSQANWVKPMQSEVRIKIKIKTKQSKATVKQIKAKHIKTNQTKSNQHKSKPIKSNLI